MKWPVPERLSQLMYSMCGFKRGKLVNTETIERMAAAVQDRGGQCTIVSALCDAFSTRR